MKDNFRRARRILRESNATKNVIAVNGCGYGRTSKPERDEYVKLCGQRFWEFISGEEDLYTKIIEPLGYKAKEKNEEFNDSYVQMINNFTVEFSNEFCINGIVDWEKLVKFNSGKENPRKKNTGVKS